MTASGSGNSAGRRGATGAPARVFTRMRRFPFVLVVVLMTAVSPNAVTFDWDWGGLLDNTTIVRFSEMYDDAEWTQKLQIGLWGAGLRRLDGGGTIELTGAGSYTYTDERDYIFDVDLLRAVGRFPGAMGSRSMLQAAVGRTLFRDPTGLILDHTADGGTVRISYPWGRIRAGAAYTGLLLSPNSSIRISGPDYQELSSDDEFFGPQRIIGLLDVTLGGVTLFTLAQKDLRDDGDTIDTQYFGISGVGRLGRSLYWDNLLIVSTGQTEIGAAEDTLLSFVAGTGLRFFAEELRFSRASLRALYASPFLPLDDDLGFDINEFKPITEPTLGLVFNPRLSNLIFTELEYSLRPFAGPQRTNGDMVRVGVAGRGFFRGYTGDIDYIDKFDPDSDSLYLGTELELAISARLFSDLGLSLRSGVFLPGSGDAGAFSDERKPEWALRLDLSSAF